MKFSTLVTFLLLLLLPVTFWGQSTINRKPATKAIPSSQATVSEPVKPTQVNSVIAPKNSPVVKGQINLVWGKPITDKLTNDDLGKKFLNCKGALYIPENHFLPEYFNHYMLKPGSDDASVSIVNPKYEPLTSEELKVLTPDEKWIQNDVVPSVKIGSQYKELFAYISFTPIRKNMVTGSYEKLVSFSLDVKQTKREARVRRSPISFARNSVLSKGTWLRIGVTSDGIYKLNYSFFKNAGVDMSSLVPKNIRVYGNGGAMLPQSNAVYRPDDLLENAVYVQGQNDAAFQAGDYVLFYGQGPTVWTYNSTDKKFHHTVNLYADTSYYYINIDLGPGKRIGTELSRTTATDTVTGFDDYAYHELDGKNLIQTGNEWFGEYFESTTQYTISFNFPNIIKTNPAYINAEVASRNCGCNSCLNYYMVGPDSLPIADVSCVYTAAYASMGAKSYTFLPSSTSVSTTITKLTTSAVGWIYFVEANVRRTLSMPITSNIYQMEFRDSKSVGAGKVSMFNVLSSDSIQVWDVTNPQNVNNVSFLSKTGGSYKFALPTDSLKQFVSFTNNGADSTVAYFGRVANQNLHIDSDADEIIVTNPLFYAQAQQLASYHINHDNLRVRVVTTQQVYNEFSSGRQDPTAIRDYLMMYDRRANNIYANSPKYLLLFGDGSFDPKNRLSGNTNYVVSYESADSFDPLGSYVSDDYFVFLDSTVTTAPENGTYFLSLSVGRIPADNIAEAQATVNKIIGYETPSGQPVNTTTNCCNTQVQYNLANWRNTICFIAHDGNNDLFQQVTEPIAAYVDSNYRNLNVNKIYFDAYPIVQTPGGERYPAVNAAIDNQMNQGALVINYEGHGGPTGLGLERVLDFSDIYSWTNSNALPLFFNGSCAFGAWDNPLQVSGGELSLSLPTGGVIGMISATREVYAEGNQILNDNFIDDLYTLLPDGSLPRIGDLLTQSKNANGSNVNYLAFCLLGDPAVRLNYPKYQVYTTSINAKTIASTPEDTLKALSKVTVTGYVGDSLGNVLTSFNGLLNPTLYDKYNKITTLANLDTVNSPHQTFEVQNSVLYKGMVSVNNGKFTFSFVMPKDILYYYGFGKISYYAQNQISDASGNYQKVVIGGTSSLAHNNGAGPKIRLFMNDSNFAYGGLTNQNPSLFAILFDSNGINTTGTSIGHNITAVLDDNTANTYDLTSYYQPTVNSYQRGTITFPFSALPNGTHTLSLRVWNVYDNTSLSTTEFNVEPQSSLQLQHVLNYPNPFTTHTQFFFEINEVCDVMDVQIQIFSVSGKLVRNILTSVKTDSFRSQPIDWDGKDDYGDKIGRGVYIYHVKVRTSGGTTADTYQKLVIL